jgi:prepilin-type N-terminal cleavage/methylation domain-containing protein
MKKGFTLIELLVVIAIIAVLATATVLILNPAELLKQGRDSTRVSDLAALNSAISLWVSDVQDTTTHWPATNVYNCTYSTTLPTSGGAGCTINTNTTVNGVIGWVPLNFTLITTGSPLSRLPMDPANGSATCSRGSPAVCEYAFAASSTVGVYEIDAQLESAKFNTGGGSHLTDMDGGNDNNWYEMGSNLNLF